jgi:transcriptional regulator with XRE-family HTH domain
MSKKAKLHPMTTYAQVIGRVLASRRRRHNFTQEDMGNRLGMGQSAWAKAERGSGALTLLRFTEAADALWATPSQVLREVEEAVEGLVGKGVEVLTRPPATMRGRVLVSPQSIDDQIEENRARKA